MNIPITTPKYHTYLSHHICSTADYFGMGRPLSYRSYGHNTIQVTVTLVYVFKLDTVYSPCHGHYTMDCAQFVPTNVNVFDIDDL